MELYQLRTFAAVADEGHLTRASERLHLSQPAVSGHVKALEGELGVRLFERASTGMQLTAAGAELLERARLVLSAADDVKRAAKQMQGDVAGLLRVGTVADPESNRLGELLALARDTHPRLKLELHHAMSGAALAGVQRASSTRASSSERLRVRSFCSSAAAIDLSSGRAGRMGRPGRWRAVGRDQPVAVDRTPNISTHTRLVGDLFAHDRCLRRMPRLRLTTKVWSPIGRLRARSRVDTRRIARRLERAGEVVIWTRAAIDTALWFVCLAGARRNRRLPRCSTSYARTWKLDPAPLRSADR